MAIRTRKNTTSEMKKNLIKTEEILYDDLSNNRESRLPIVAAARVRAASSSTARSTRSGCLRTEGESEVSPTSSSTVRAFLARNRKNNMKGRTQISRTMNDRMFGFNVGK